MKAIIKMAAGTISLPVEYVEQQTCISTVFKNVPFGAVSVPDLVLAKQSDVVTGWYKSTNGYSIDVKNEVIEWKEEE